jgi:hypothetical protein
MSGSAAGCTPNVVARIIPGRLAVLKEYAGIICANPQCKGAVREENNIEAYQIMFPNAAINIKKCEDHILTTTSISKSFFKTFG